MAKKFPVKFNLKDLFEKGLASIFKVKPRLPDLIELALGQTGYFQKVRTSGMWVPNWVYNKKTKKMEQRGKKWYVPDKKYHYFKDIPSRQKVKRYWRGETLHPDEQYISKAGLEAKMEGAEPGSWYSSEPLESQDYVVRTTKGEMGQEVTNPGIIRNITADEIRKIDPEWAKKYQIGDMGALGQANLPPHIREQSKISLIPSLVIRLRKLGFTKSEIFSTIKQITSKKKASGERDWKWYNKGGITSLIS